MIDDLVVLKKEDIDDIDELFSIVYPGRDENETYWEWLFDNPVFVYRPMGLRRDGKLVAMHAYTICGDYGMSSSAMTHPDYRGKGCWTPLVHYNYIETEYRGCKYLILFSNEAIHPIHKHFGFEDLYQIKEYRIPIEDLEIDIGRGYYPRVYQLNSYDEWRYKKHPLNTYIYYINPITGDFMIFSVYKNRLQIISYKNLEKAIGVGAHIGNLLNKDIISFWSKKELDYPSIIIPTWLMIRNLNHPNFDKIKQIWKNQPLMMGDSDVY